METTSQSVGKPWTKRSVGHIFSVRLLPTPEGETFLDSESGVPNQELLNQMVPVLLSLPPTFQVIFYKEEMHVGIKDIYPCIYAGFKETFDKPETNELLGLILDALKNLGTATKKVTENAPSTIPPVLTSFVDGIINDGSLKVGAVVNIDEYLCLLKIDTVPALFISPT
jgi:hypothetical protein